MFGIADFGAFDAATIAPARLRATPRTSATLKKLAHVFLIAVGIKRAISR